MKTNLFKKIYYKTTDWLFSIDWWFYKNSPVYIDFNLFKSIWWYIRCCLVFKSPDIIIYNDDNLTSDYWLTPTAGNSYNKILSITCRGIGWKPKYNEPRHENNPYISIVWRNKKTIVIGFEAPLFGFSKYYYRENMIYYEAICDYLYYNKRDIVELFNNHIWKDSSNKPNTFYCALRNKYKRIIDKAISDNKIKF